MTTDVRLQTREEPGQLKWFDFDLPDLRKLTRELRSAALEEVTRADNFEGALAILYEHFGFTDISIAVVSFETPVGIVWVPRNSLDHIVEKRADSRERYVRHALDTLTGPFEVWRIGGHRLAFINADEAKNDMIVVVDIQRGHVLWNFFHAPSRSMNKHRQGELLYRRYELKGKEKGQL